MYHKIINIIKPTKMPRPYFEFLKNQVINDQVMITLGYLTTHKYTPTIYLFIFVYIIVVQFINIETARKYLK